MPVRSIRSWYEDWQLVFGFYGTGKETIGRTLADFFNFVPITGPRSELCEIMTAHGSDKGAAPDHNYTMLYDFLFRDRRNDVKNVFELGIGTNFTDLPANMGEDGRPGASLRGWRDYFPGARIVGADIDRRILFEEERIATHYVDQTDPDSIRELWSHYPGALFDIMVDDGLHQFEANATFMSASFDKLGPGGFYIIEDIKTRDEGNMESFDLFFRESGWSGAMITLPHASNQDDNCLAIFVRDDR